MKLYEYSQKKNNTTYIGVILADDNEKVCMDRVFSTNRENYSYLSGLEMAASFIKNNGYNQHGELIFYGPHLGLNDPVTSAYIKRVLPYQRIIPNTQPFTEKDKEYSLLVKNRVDCIITPIELYNKEQNCK